MIRKLEIYIISIALLVFTSCEDQPKEVEPENSSNSESIFNESSQGPSTSTPVSPEVKGKINKVKALEVLPTQKYVYIRVENMGTKEKYWIATNKQEITIGDIYYYKSGLLKQNFHSNEYNRTFNKMLLVDNIVPENHGQQMSSGNSENPPNLDASKVTLAGGSTPIATLVENPAQYANQQVQITGIVTKVNNNIMKRNWVHLKDHSGSDFDFVATTDADLKVGQTVTLTGTLATGKDFGAGYSYELILENCQLVK